MHLDSILPIKFQQLIALPQTLNVVLHFKDYLMQYFTTHTSRCNLLAIKLKILQLRNMLSNAPL